MNTKTKKMIISEKYIKQDLNLLVSKKRKKVYTYNEGCGCCFFRNHVFLSGNKVVLSSVHSHLGNISAEATVIGKVKNCR